MKIGIVCAFKDEILYFIEKYHLKMNKDIEKMKVGNNEVYLALTGVGKVNAALFTQKLISEYRVDLILNCGCSGALSETLPLYSIVLGDAVFYHDFVPHSIMEKYVPQKGYMKADSFLLNQALEIGKSTEFGKIEAGPLVSGDCYVTEETKKKELIEKGALCVDMESAAIGHVCQKNHIPFLPIRSISDFADGKEVDEKESSRRAALLTEALIDRL